MTVLAEGSGTFLAPDPDAQRRYSRDTFVFDEETHRIRLTGIAPWTTVDDVVAEMEFEPLVASALEDIDVPGEEELAVLRAQVDPTGRTVKGRWITVELDGKKASLVEQEAPTEGA